MSSASSAPASSKIMVWSGRILSALIVILMVAGGGFKTTKPKEIVDGFQKFGYPESSIVPIGITEIACGVLYAIPQTSVLGAILVTGYLGGATATHVIGGESVIPPVLIGMVAWLGLFLRDARIRALIPLKR